LLYIIIVIIIVIVIIIINLFLPDLLQARTPRHYRV